jgi:hypothetical protein
MKMLCGLLLVFVSINVFASCGDSLAGIKKDSMKIKISFGQKTAFGVLYDNPAAKEFALMLPLTLQLEDYNATEKISTLPKKLDTRKEAAGYKPSAGDLTYYAPWGNLALFYKGFGYSTGLIALGKLTHGIEYFQATGLVTVRIETLPD